MKSFKHSGDFGDIVYSLLTVKELGGGDFFCGKNKETRIQMDQSRLETIKPLLQSQGYIGKVGLITDQRVDYDLNEFRTLHRDNYTYGKTLAEHHLDLYGLQLRLSETAWITGITPRVIQGKKVVFNRTDRYHGNEFPWSLIHKEWGPHAVFVGLKDEHSEFERRIGKVDYMETGNLLEAAEVIKGSQWFVGNQSCCFAIAEAMKCNVIQETCVANPDCIFRRDGAMHIAGNYINLPILC